MNPYIKLATGLLATPLTLSLALAPIVNPTYADAAGHAGQAEPPAEAPTTEQAVLKDGKIQTLSQSTPKPEIKGIRIYSATSWHANAPKTIRVALNEQNVSPEKPYYTVQDGDTVWALAEAAQSTVKKIANDNHLKNPDLIYIDQRLITKTSGKETPKAEKTSFHTQKETHGTTSIVSNGKVLTVQN